MLTIETLSDNNLYIIEVVSDLITFGVYNLVISCSDCIQSSGIKQVELLPGAVRKLCDVTTVIYYWAVLVDESSYIGKQVYVNPNEAWSLQSLTQDTWHIKIELGDSWKFDQNQISAITFKIDGECGTPYCDPLFAISINDTKYFSGSISYDGNNDNIISPICDSMLYNGNIFERVHNHSGFVKISRAEYVYNYGVDTKDNYQQLHPNMNGDVRFPSEYTIINNPIDNTTTFEFTHLYTNIIQSCKWTESISFDINKGIDLYLSPNIDGEIWNIYSITIKYQGPTIAPTYSPSSAPTQPPTLSPTQAPTLPPTRYPQQVILTII